MRPKRGHRAKRNGLGALTLSLALTACDEFGPVDPVLTPKARPDGAGQTEPDAPRATSEKSASLRSYLTEVQSSQLTQGLLRQDGGGPDTPFTAEMLARNFINIAFFSEYGRSNAGPLNRWDEPVRMAIAFGPSVPPSQRMQDRSDVVKFANRLSRVSGHPISVGGNPNFLVIFAGEDDRAETLDRLSKTVPGFENVNTNDLANLRDDIYCAVVADDQGEAPNTYTHAIAVIRAENPDLLRLSCIHEELAQGLGLQNDSPQARPSIFNDDDEFALLTNHDEALLKMLYDSRLRAGMTLNEARPIIRQLAAERLGGPS
ncbi:MAG: DUF2927 domain-containing protein [Pseudomonadota bacterium]